MAMVRRLVAAASLACALAVLAGCSGTGAASDQETVCPQLAGLEGTIAPTLLAATPEGTVGGAAFGVALTIKTAQEVTQANASQRLLLDRVTRAATDYQKALSTRDPNTSLAENASGLDAYQQNLLSSYRTLLEDVGCPIPAYASPKAAAGA